MRSRWTGCATTLLAGAVAVCICSPSSRATEATVDPKFLTSLAAEIQAKGHKCPSVVSAARERIDAFGLSIRVDCGATAFRVTLRADAEVDVEPLR